MSLYTVILVIICLAVGVFVVSIIKDEYKERVVRDTLHRIYSGNLVVYGLSRERGVSDLGTIMHKIVMDIVEEEAAKRYAYSGGLVDENEKLRVRVDDKNEELESLRKDNKRLNHDLAILREEMVGMEERLEEKEDCIKKKDEELERLHARIREISEANRRSKEGLLKERSKLRRKREELERREEKIRSDEQVITEWYDQLLKQSPWARKVATIESDVQPLSPLWRPAMSEHPKI